MRATGPSGPHGRRGKISVDSLSVVRLTDEVKPCRFGFIWSITRPFVSLCLGIIAVYTFWLFAGR